MTGRSAIFDGDVVHVRLRPKAHKLRYRVFSLLLDVDEIDGLARRSRLFSRNRFNVVSFHDRDHGAGDGVPVAEQARSVFREAGLDGATHRISLLAYPRVLGYVFNPLSVYYGYGAEGELEGVIYEVNNTVGERKSYVVAAGCARDGVYAHGCTKDMYVSPFTPANAAYGFRLTAPGRDLLVGVSLRDGEGAILRTHFRGTGRPFSDRALLSALVRHPMLTLKVVGAIHWEALRLFLKGVPVVRRHRSPRYSISWKPADDRG